ncbi:MAG: hypothetical protein GY718_01945 [Lentisphaerae bacterium]|nr:hypothetical protein [Lentisphaerota bacterium]
MAKVMEFETLKGKTLSGIDRSEEEIIFIVNENESYKLYHDQGCCERVTVEDICGDLKDLLGTPILLAEMAQSNENPKDVEIVECQDESYTWTFYKLSTVIGSVTIRWYGESNGYYSEEVDFERVEHTE